MFELLTGIVYRGRWVVVVCTVVLAGFAGYYGGPVAGLLTDDSSNFEDPASESVAAEERLADAADANPGADVVALVEVDEDVKSSAGQEKVRDVAGTIADDEAVAQVTTYFQTRDEAWISDDGDATYVVASFDPDADDAAAVERLHKEFAGDEGVTRRHHRPRPSGPLAHEAPRPPQLVVAPAAEVAPRTHRPARGHRKRIKRKATKEQRCAVDLTRGTGWVSDSEVRGGTRERRRLLRARRGEV